MSEANYVGRDNVKKWGFDIHNPVFVVSAGLIFLFLIATLASDPSVAKAPLDGIKWKIIANFDILFIWTGNIMVLFCLAKWLKRSEHWDRKGSPKYRWQCSRCLKCFRWVHCFQLLQSSWCWFSLLHLPIPVLWLSTASQPAARSTHQCRSVFSGLQ